jgi:hypothetical protein
MIQPIIGGIECATDPDHLGAQLYAVNHSQRGWVLIAMCPMCAEWARRVTAKLGGVFTS